MKKHILIKELGEGFCRSVCQLSIPRYEGVKRMYLPERAAEVTCERCRKASKL